MTATILATVNIYFGFYTSWQDLLGGGAQGYQLQVAPAPPVASANAAQIPAVAGVTASGPLAIHGLRSGISANLKVILPPGYQNPSNAGTSYPVIVVDNTGPAGSTGGSITAPGALGSDQIAALIVYVDNDGAPAIPCTNVAGSAGQQGALFWDQDLRTALAARFRVNPNAAVWAVLGGGANGACAATLAVLSSGYYSAAATIGPWTQPAAPPQDPPALADGPQQWAQLYPGPPSDILLVDPDQATESNFATNPGALRVQVERAMSAREVFAWLANADEIGASG